MLSICCTGFRVLLFVLKERKRDTTQTGPPSTPFSSSPEAKFCISLLCMFVPLVCFLLQATYMIIPLEFLLKLYHYIHPFVPTFGINVCWCMVMQFIQSMVLWDSNIWKTYWNGIFSALSVNKSVRVFRDCSPPVWAGQPWGPWEGEECLPSSSHQAAVTLRWALRTELRMWEHRMWHWQLRCLWVISVSPGPYSSIT